MPRSIFSKFTASSRAPLAQSVICNGEDSVYLMEPVNVTQVNPATFWASPLADNYPTMRHLARKYLSIPATSASVERLFSVAGAIIRARRSSLAATTVESLLLHSELLS